MSVQLLEVFLFEVGTVLRLERDAWSMVKCLRQAANQYPPPTPHSPFVFVRNALVCAGRVGQPQSQAGNVQGPHLGECAASGSAAPATAVCRALALSFRENVGTRASFCFRVDGVRGYRSF